MGFTLGEGSVNGECTANFWDVPVGRYRLSVRGVDAANADEGDVEINSVISQQVDVRARHTKESDLSHWAARASFISVTELGVPANAAKEFQKATRLIAKQDWDKAAERIHRGLAIYPNYASGYNDLGVVYSHLGNNAQAREALQHAIALDDHLALAYANLGRLCVVDNDFASAESLLTKAISLETVAQSEELFLLAYAQLTDHHLEQAIQTSRRGHESKSTPHGFLHLVAAKAYEQQNRRSESMAELQSYLSEEPKGPHAEEVRKALATPRAHVAVNSALPSIAAPPKSVRSTSAVLSSDR